MNATLAYEPYRIPAGLLALVVHSAFFVLLYFGFTWQTRPAETMSVELWTSLPEADVAPPPAPRVVEAVQPAQPVKQLAKPDIALPDKKDKRKVETKPVVTVPDKKTETKPAPQTSVEQMQAEADQRERLAAQQAAQTARERSEQAARDKAAQDAAIDAMVKEYGDKITNKIRGKVRNPPGVADDASAEFRVTLLPGGTVLSVELIKSSGNEAYDKAVELAIRKAEPLPLPADVAMFKHFRVLRPKFMPFKHKSAE